MQLHQLPQATAAFRQPWDTPCYLNLGASSPPATDPPKSIKFQHRFWIDFEPQNKGLNPSKINQKST